MNKLPGAKCDGCPFAEQPCVPPTGPQGPLSFILVGEAPGKYDAALKRPFVGRSGELVTKALTKAGLNRNEAFLTNAVACLPPHGHKKKDLIAARKHCAGRLELELEEHAAPKITFGEQALVALTGKAGILDWFGSPLDDVFPMFHPAFAMRAPVYGPLFNHFLKRAGRWVKGKHPVFQWPPYHDIEGPDMLYALRAIAETGDRVGFDVETGGKDPIYSPLICVGVANDAAMVSVQWPPRSQEVYDALKTILQGPQAKVAHNSQHDTISLKANGLPVQGAIIDTLLMHVAAHPQLPHRLNFVGTQYTYAERYKSVFKAEGEHKGDKRFIEAAKHNMGELQLYNAKDSFIVVPISVALEETIARED